MNGYNPPAVELQTAIARGWSDDYTSTRLGCPVAAVAEARAWLDELVAEDPPFFVEVKQ